MFVHVVIQSFFQKTAYQPFSKVDSIDEVSRYLQTSLVLIEECELICTDPPENNTCFQGGILHVPSFPSVKL